MSNFISTYLTHTSIYESPGSFWKWSTYASIAAVLRDNCFLRQGDRKLFPNIYILFLAESSGHRKGPPIDLSETMVTKVNNTKVISGRSSVEAILDELARTETNKKTGVVQKSGSAIFYGAEMAAGIVASEDALKILTDIYDYKTNPYKSRLRTGPCFNLERIVFSMLSGSNEAMLKGLFGMAEIQGGFLARTLLVTPNEHRPPNSLMRLDPEERSSSFRKVLNCFEEVAKLNGEFILEEDAIDEYESWYNPFKLSYQQKKETSGIVGRIHNTIIKIAMIMAANELTLHVKKHHMEEAISACLSLLPNYSIFTMSNGKSELSQAGGIIIGDLLMAKDHTLSKKEIFRKQWQAIGDTDTFEKIITALEYSGNIQQVINGSDHKIRLTPACLVTLGVIKETKRVQ